MVYRKIDFEDAGFFPKIDTGSLVIGSQSILLKSPITVRNSANGGYISLQTVLYDSRAFEARFDAKIPRWSAQGVSGFIFKGGEKLLNFAVADERRSLSGSAGW